MYITDLVKLCEKAWALHTLALIEEGTPVRVAVLANAAGTSRTSIRPSIQHLFDLGLLTANKGHGHPLRPEAKLTAKGKRWASLAKDLEAILAPQDSPITRLTWTLPTLRVAHTPVRFVSIREALSPVRDSTLSNTLHRLETTGWLERQVNAKLRPPQVSYLAIERGREIANVLHERVKL